MQKSAAIDHFGGITKLAARLGISRQAIHAWPKEVPDRWAYQIHYLSDGKLRLSPALARPRPKQGRAAA